MPDLVLRAYLPSDLAQVVALFQASVHQLGGANYNPGQLAAWAPPTLDHARWADRLAAQSVVLAERAGSLAGFCSWTADGYLDLLYVHPGHARQGVATALYAAAEQSLRAHRATRVHTEASVTAQPFFLRQGFRVVCHQVVHVRGTDLPNAVMEKSLA